MLWPLNTKIPSDIQSYNRIITKLIRNTGKIQTVWILTPLFGVLLFSCLYIISTFYYSGGSQADKNAIGFSWIHNYWCNLLNINAINGKPNLGRPIAMTSMITLCVTLAAFWYIFPQYVDFKIKYRVAIQISGVVSMITTIFIFTSLHDIIINVAGFFGLVAVLGTIMGVYKLKWFGLFCLGVFNLTLVIINNILYYNNGLIYYLPVVQKISFLFFLLWIVLIDIKMFRNKAVSSRQSAIGH